MRLRVAVLALLLASAGMPSAASAQDINTGITSTKAASAISISAEPALSDGRLVLRVAAQNRTQAPVAFGPASVRVATAAGDVIAVRPLSALIAETRAAAGMDDTGLVLGVTEAPAILTNNSGQKDVSGFTGGMVTAVAQPARKRKPKPAEVAAAEAQIAALKAGILAETMIAPGQLAAGQLVTEKIKFRNKRERGLVVTVTLAGEEHNFKFDAPAGYMRAP